MLIELDVGKRFARVPRALAADVDIGNVVVLGIQRLRRLQGGDDGDIMLAGAAAVDHADIVHGYALPCRYSV